MAEVVINGFHWGFIHPEICGVMGPYLQLVGGPPCICILVMVKSHPARAKSKTWMAAFGVVNRNSNSFIEVLPIRWWFVIAGWCGKKRLMGCCSLSESEVVGLPRDGLLLLPILSLEAELNTTWWKGSCGGVAMHSNKSFICCWRTRSAGVIGCPAFAQTKRDFKQAS